MTMGLGCFKACDIRGKRGNEFNEDITYRIGRACGKFLKPGSVVIASDVSKNPVIARKDGVSLEFSGSRLNLCPSNTETLLCLSVKARGDVELVGARVSELVELIGKF